MCSHSKMRFVSNPYNFGVTDEEKQAKQIDVDLDCVAFPYIDEEDPDAKPQMVVHYSMNKKPEFNGLDKITDEDLQDKLFIDRNTFNEQYFNLTFDDNFEYLKVNKHVMYKEEIGVQDNAEDKTFEST